MLLVIVKDIVVVATLPVDGRAYQGYLGHMDALRVSTRHENEREGIWIILRKHAKRCRGEEDKERTANKGRKQESRRAKKWFEGTNWNMRIRLRSLASLFVLRSSYTLSNAAASSSATTCLRLLTFLLATRLALGRATSG
jgi:hypothetical protein